MRVEKKASMKIDFHRCVLVHLLVSLLGLAFPAAAQTVNIPDPALQSAIRGALNKPAGEITVADMENLQQLSCRSYGFGPEPIGSLEGLEAAKNLTTLRLEYDRVQKLALPLGRVSLTTLDLSRNQLTNLSLPATFSNLANLNLSANQLTNLTLPAAWSNLITLNFSANQLINLTLPDGLDNLKDLDLSENQLENFAIPKGGSNLINLNLSHNQVTNLTLPWG